MRAGILSKAELVRLRRAWETLEQLQAALPSENLNGTERATLGLLVDSRNRAGDLLRWQDPTFTGHAERRVTVP